MSPSRISLVILLSALLLSMTLLLIIGPAPLLAQCESGDEGCKEGGGPNSEAGEISILADNYTGATFTLINSLGADTFERQNEGVNQTCGGSSGFTVRYNTHEFVNATNETQTVDIEMTLNGTSTLDPFLHIYNNSFDKDNPTDNCLKANDNSVASQKAVIRRFTWNPGQRLVIVALSKNTGQADASYKLEIRPAGQDDNELDNARPISPNIDWVTDEISPTDDIDYYRFQAKDGQRVWVYVRTDQSTTGKNSHVELWKLQTDSTTTTIEIDDDDGGQNGGSSSIAGAEIGSGGIYTYYVQVKSADGNAISPYYLYVYLSDQDPLDEDDTGGGNNTRGTANGYSSDGKQLPQIFKGFQVGSDTDFFKFTVSGKSVVFIGLDADPNNDVDDFRGKLELYDSDSVPLVASAVDNAKDASPSVALSYGQIASETVAATTWYASVISDTTGSDNLPYRLLLGSSPISQGEVTYSTDVDKTIIDDGTITSTLISGHYCVNNLDVWLDIDHDNLDDLDVSLKGPAGTEIDLFTDRGGDDNGLIITLDDDGGLASLPDDGVTATDVKIGGRYRTNDSTLSKFVGKNGIGQWTLTITDDTSGNSGVLNNWALIMHCSNIYQVYLPLVIKDN